MSTEFKYIVRIAGRDLDGGKKLVAALADIRGVGWNFAHSIVNALRLDPNIRLGLLTEEQVNMIENVLKDTSKINLPYWFLNRRKDLDLGINTHLFGSDLEFAIKMDIERERLVNSWRGIRHSLGLKVRGQRTRTTGRKGRTVGVRKGAK